jgi:transposase InsO family protein
VSVKLVRTDTGSMSVRRKRKTQTNEGPRKQNRASATSAGASCYHISGNIAGVHAEILLDSGSEVSLIDASSPILKHLQLQSTSIKPFAINSDPISVKGTVTADIRLHNLTSKWTFVVVEGITSTVVLGVDFIRAHHQKSWGVSGDKFWLDDTCIPLVEHRRTRACTEWAEPVVSRCTVILPARHQVMVELRRKDKRRGDIGLFEGDKAPEGVLFSKVVNQGDEQGKFWARAVNYSDEPVTLYKNQKLGTLSSAANITDHLVPTSGSRSEKSPDLQSLGVNLADSDMSASQKTELETLLLSYTDVFSTGPEDIGHYTGVQHRIHVKPDTVPLRQPVRRIPMAYQDQVKIQIQRMLKIGVIEKSTSPWASPLVIVKKPSGDLRICVDYRGLNTNTVKDCQPLPNITDTLDKMAGAKYYSSFDLVAGYHQIEMAEVDRDKTAFISPYGLFQYRRLPFGLCNSGSTFQRVMNDLIQVMSVEDLLSYLDDFVLFHGTFREHLQGIERLLKLLKKSGFKLSGKKCQFVRKEVSFLGHIVSEEGIRPQPGKLRAIQEWPVPSNRDEVIRFLGLCGFYRRYIRDYAQISAPLFDTKEDDFVWDKTCQDAFEKLKVVMSEHVTLKLPDPNEPFIVTCDASNVAVGFVLEQIVHAGQRRPVAFGSRKLNKAEKNYSTTERECLAVMEALKAYRPYLLGREFTIYTDHQALKWLLTRSNPDNSRLWRWAHKMSEYSFTVFHKPGKDNVVADALSRIAAVVLEPEWTTASIFAEQQKDPDLVRLRTELQKKRQNLREFSVAKGRLSVDTESNLIVYDHKRIVLPATLQKTALVHCHDSSAVIHPRFEQTLARVKERFYWTTVTRDTENWVKSCLTCQERKPAHKQAKAPLGEMPSPTRPWEFVQIDLKGPLPETPRGNKYLMVVYDYFSKYVVAAAIPDKRMETVTNAFVERVVLIHGLPGGLCSDQGKEFESRVLLETCQQMGVAKVRTSVAHPASNGGVERTNKTLGNLLRLVIRPDQMDWDVRTPYAVFAYNTSRHSSTDLTPYEINSGLRKPRLHDRAVVEQSIETDEVVPSSGENVSSYRDRLEKAFTEVEQHLSLTRAQRKQCAEKKLNYIPIQQGEQVWLKNWKREKGLNAKLVPSWNGPYTVVKKISDLTYLIKRKNGRRFVIHHNMLRRFIERDRKWCDAESTCADSDPPPANETSNVDLAIQIEDVVEEAGHAPVVEEIPPDVLPNEEMSDGNDSSLAANSEGDPASSSSSEAETESEDEGNARQQVTRGGRAVQRPTWMKDYQC